MCVIVTLCADLEFSVSFITHTARTCSLKFLLLNFNRVEVFCLKFRSLGLRKSLTRWVASGEALFEAFANAVQQNRVVERLR